MSKIKINQISDSEVEVLLDNDVPLAMAESLSKGLQERGLVQDDSRSSLGRRYFVRHSPFEVEDRHEQLMKSLEKMVKADAATKQAWEQKRQSRLVDRNKRREGQGMSPITMDQFKNPSSSTPPKAPTMSPSPSGPNTLPGVPNTMFNPQTSGKVNYTKKSEHDAKCGCVECDIARKADLNKSLRDKLSGGNKWGQHLPFPSADQPNTNQPLPTADEIMAGQLANMMMNKGMMKAIPGAPLLGSIVPSQPTDQEMFGHLVPSEEQLRKGEQAWNNRLNNWQTEAQKPLNARFKSEEEELAYWSSLSVNDSGE